MWCRVLIVDDEPYVVASLRRELLRKPDLSAEGVEVESFGSAAEALQRVTEPDGIFDVALVDFRMPDMDGITLLGKLREAQPDMVRVLLTGLIDMDGAIAAVNAARVDQIITKPWHEYDLKARVALALRQRVLLQQRRLSVQQADDGLSRPYLIQLVDDEASQINALEREISLQGRATRGPHALFEIVKTTDPELGLLMATQRCPDILIADYRMPRLNGIELLSKLKAQCPHCVSILLSGTADRDALVQAVNEAGIYHFVQKPWDAVVLRGIIAEALAYRDLIGAAD